MNISSLTLKGENVWLEPLQASHCDALYAVARDGELYRTDLTTVPSSLVETEHYIHEAISGREREVYLPFVIVQMPHGRIVGTTRYREINHRHRRLEIGSTWLAKSVQRTVINSEAKLVLLEHAFEQLGCLRVEFLTDVLNQQSRKALERLGASFEGILRMHMIMPTGRSRDSACYSIVEREWPLLKERLKLMIQGK